MGFLEDNRLTKESEKITQTDMGVLDENPLNNYQKINDKGWYNGIGSGNQDIELTIQKSKINNYYNYSVRERVEIKDNVPVYMYPKVREYGYGYSENMHKYVFYDAIPNIYWAHKSYNRDDLIHEYKQRINGLMMPILLNCFTLIMLIWTSTYLFKTGFIAATILIESIILLTIIILTVKYIRIIKQVKYNISNIDKDPRLKSYELTNEYQAPQIIKCPYCDRFVVKDLHRECPYCESNLMAIPKDILRDIGEDKEKAVD